MKKLYFFLIGSMVATSSFGQYSQNSAMTKSKSEAQPGVSVQTNRAPGDVIGSVMDFSNSANWTTDNSGVTAGTGWEITDQGPTGFFSGGMGPISSTSGGDFALFDADGAPGTGYIQMANPVDLSAEGNVALQFESYYRAFQGSAYFEVSTDGTNWTDFQVHATLPLNESTANPQVVTVNISSIAANEATVWVRFRYDSGDDYAWMVDDVAFVEGYDDELILGDVFMSAGNEMLDYYQIPTELTQDFTFGARLENGGVNNQTNSTLNVVVNDGTSNIYDENSTPTTVNAFATDSFEITTPFVIPGDGTYDVSYDLSSDATDQNTANNSTTLETITVGGDVYARDNGVPSGSVGYLGNTAQQTLMGQYFEFTDNFLIGQVEIFVSANAVAGEVIYAELRALNAAGDAFDFVANSDDYILQTNDIGSSIVLDITNGGYNTQAGDVIEVLAGHYGSEDVRVVTAQFGIGAVIYNNGQRSAQNSLFMIRPIRGFASVDENNIDMTAANVYPNPAKDECNVTFNLNNVLDVEITITDLTGKIVSSKTLNNLNKGEHNEAFELSSFESGMYTVNIKSDNKSVTRRLVIQ